MKKLVLLTVFTMVMFAAGSAFANVPNTDYAQTGKGAVSISISRSDVDVEGNGETFSLDKHWNFGAKAEVVVAPKWAVGLNYINSKSDETNLIDGVGDAFRAEASLRTFELTAQYMAYQKNGFSIIPYVGWARDKGEIKIIGEENSSKSNNDFLLGSKFVYEFNKKFVSYADLGFGGDIFKWGIGVAYKFTPELALSLGYDYRKVKDFDMGDGDKFDGKTKNIVIGVTYLF